MSEDVNARLQQVEAALNNIKIRAGTLVDDARRAVDAALESETWDVSARVDNLRDQVQVYLEDAFDGRRVTLESLSQDADLIIESFWGVLGAQFSFLLAEIENHLYAALDSSRRSIQGLVDGVADQLDLVLIASNTAIDQATTIIDDTNTGIIDTVTNTINGLLGEGLGMAEALIGVAADIVDPLAVLLTGIAESMTETLTGLLTFDADTFVNWQGELAAAIEKQTGGA